MSEKKLMDKDDAKYLIDQFNKFASWGVSQPLQQVYSTLALIVGCWAIITSLFVAFLQLFPPPSVMERTVVGFGIPTVMFILILFFLRRVSRLSGKVMDAHGRNIEKLTALMDYLSKCGSLPSDLTFEKIVKSKPEDLRKSATSEEGRPISEIDRLIAQISPMFLALTSTLGIFLFTNVKDQMTPILFSIGSICFLISTYVSIRLYVTREQTKEDWDYRRFGMFCFLYGITSPVTILIGIAYRAMASLGGLSDGYIMLLFLVLNAVLAYWGSGDLIKRIKHET